MDITLLYDNAYEMLAETNVYSRPPEQLAYHDHRGEKYALLELVRSHPMIGSRRMSSDKRSGVKINNAKCYQAIAEAMVKYADSYPAPSSFKKRMRENFVRWLEAIRSKYEFPEWPEMLPGRVSWTPGSNRWILSAIWSEGLSQCDAIPAITSPFIREFTWQNLAMFWFLTVMDIRKQAILAT